MHIVVSWHVCVAGLLVPRSALTLTSDCRSLIVSLILTSLRLISQEVESFRQDFFVSFRLGVTREDLSSQAQQLIKKIEDAPEAEEEVPDSAYYAKPVLNILAFALEAVARSEVEPATWTSSLAVNFSSELDDLLIEESQRITKLAPGELPPDGPLVMLELKYQRQSLELIESAREPSAELISSLRRLSQDANKDLEVVVAEIRKEIQQ